MEDLSKAAEILIKNGNIEDAIIEAVGVNSNVNSLLIKFISGNDTDIKKAVAEYLLFAEILYQLFEDDELDEEIESIIAKVKANEGK